MLNDQRFIRADSQLGKEMTKIRKGCVGLIREIKKPDDHTDRSGSWVFL
jgi:hypothetical protein